MKKLFLAISVLFVVFMFIGTSFFVAIDHGDNSITADYFTGIQTKVGSPYVLDVGANASTNLTLSKSQEYFFVGSTAGGGPITNESWTPDLQVYAHYSGYLSTTIGHQYNETGNYGFHGSNYGIAGVGVSNFSKYVTYNASSSTNTSLNLSFTTNAGDLVVILIGGEGDGYINTSNVPNLNIATNYTYSEGGSNVIASGAIYYGYLSSGSYTLKINSTTFPTNAGTSIGAVAYIFSPEPKSGGITSAELYAIIGAVIAIAVIGSAVAVMRKRRR